MSIVEQAKSNVSGLAEKLLGPPYDYKAKIKNTQELGMSDRGDLKTLEKDVRGIVGYMKVLIEGGGRASKVNGPLGNKFFMKTAMMCKIGGKEVPRSIYINNVPKPPLAGLIKGTTTGLQAVNPFRIFGAFADATTPECKQITLEVIDSNDRKSRETHYMTLNDIEYLNKGLLGFQNIDDEELIKNAEIVELPDDLFVRAYYICLAALGVYLVYRLMNKK